MKWAAEMHKCNEMMSEMAACQKVYEEKAISAEKKLEEWKKNNRKPTKSTKDSRSEKYQEGRGEPAVPAVQRHVREDGREVIVDETGQAVVDDNGREIFVDESGRQYVEDEQGVKSYEVKSTKLEQLEAEDEIRQTARAAVARAGQSNGHDEDGFIEGRPGRSRLGVST